MNELSGYLFTAFHKASDLISKRCTENDRNEETKPKITLGYQKGIQMCLVL